MPHERFRYGSQLIESFAKFSPAIGVVGLRQVGKTTLLTKQLGIPHCYSLDDHEISTEANSSPKILLSRINYPCVIDECQKAPPLFDTIKLRIDRKRIPGQYFLTGSTEFSSKLGIRESLTGRIAMMQLYPLTLGESLKKPFESKRALPIHALPLRFHSEDAAQALSKGGLPVPMFMRESQVRRQYFDQWLETSIARDLFRVYGRAFDQDIARTILSRMGAAFRDGRVPTVRDIPGDTRKIGRYLQAMESIFLLKRIPCHIDGTGLDRWMIGDGGLASHVMNSDHGEGSILTLARHFVLNEILAACQYSGRSLNPTYYKSAQAKEAVDFVWEGIPLKIVHAPPSQIPIGWYEKPLLGAMKTLKSKIGLIVAPTDSVDLPKKSGIGVVPWTYWS